MTRILASLAAVLLAAGLLSAPPALADFAISKPKPKPAKAPPPRARVVRHPRVSAESTEAADGKVNAPLGIDPALMQEAIVEAKYSATLTRDPAAHTAVVQATDGKTGWSVNFSNCGEDSRCRTLEFYTLWRVPNEANVCRVWGSEVTKDENRTQGKPYCYTVPGLERQLHLKLSSNQTPYAGLEKMAAPQAKERMQGMIGVWSTYLAMLPQAWTIANSRCPRASDKCG